MATQATRIRGNRTDWSIVLILVTLLVIGVTMIYSASYRFSLESGEGELAPGYYAIRQAKFIGLGILAMIACWLIPYRLYRRYARVILLLTLGILIVMAVLGRWVLGDSDTVQSIQPLELAKIGAMIYIAVWLEAIGADIRDLKAGLAPFGALLGILITLVMIQRDFSSAALLAATAVAMLFFAGANFRQILFFLLVGGAVIIAATILFKYNSERWDAWLHGPYAHAQDEGYQPIQNQIAIHNGGIFGTGLGKGTLKYKIPLPHSDDIFAVIVEELGFIGGLFVLGIYGLWCWRGLRVAFYAQDTFGTLLAAGIVSWIALQATLNMGVSTTVLPVTGTVLPFVSHGGSSIVSGMAMVGILLNISRSSGLAPEDAPS